MLHLSQNIHGEDMIVNLKAAGKSDLLPLGYAFAALVLKKLEDRD